MVIFRDSWTDKENRISTAAVDYRGLRFIGAAHCHPDDEWSYFFGCSLAETRATIEAAKYELELCREDYKSCKNFVRAVAGYKNFDPSSPSAKAMYRQLNRKKQAVERAKKRVKVLKESVVVQQENREKFKKVIDKLKMDKSNKSN